MADQRQRYSPEQVQAILERALIEGKRRGDPSGITYDELRDTARELEIEEDALQAAIHEYEETWELEDARQRWVVRRKEKFFDHLRSYMIVNSILMLIALVTGSGLWFLWPIFGWGIGLAFDASEAFFPKKKDIERGAEKLLAKEHRNRPSRSYHRQMTEGKVASGGPSRNIIIDSKQKKLIIEKGDRRIEIG